MWVVRSENPDPFHNLAVEEFLLGQVDRHGFILFLSTNRNCVVAGKNQNPWSECSLSTMSDESVPLVRRLSGGGAVYHDRGNLNYSFILPRAHYHTARQFELVLGALNRLGVRAEMMGRNSLGVNGGKISGNAFYLRGNAALHHGTILIEADLQKMARYLKPSDRHRITSRAIPSRPARVTNLKDLAPEITHEAVCYALIESCAGVFGEARAGERVVDPIAVDAMRDRYAAWEWRFGLTPPFHLESVTNFSWGHAGFRAFVEDGVIQEASLTLNGQHAQAQKEIEAVLVKRRLETDSICDALTNSKAQLPPDVVRGLAVWMAGG